MLEFTIALDLKPDAEEAKLIDEQLTEKEISFLEKEFKYSCIMYESDILRFRFDVTQFKPNVAYNIQFLDLLPMYNEYYYKYSREFLNLYKKEFTVVKVLTVESMFLLLLTDSERAFNRLKDLSHMKSYKWKANFTRKERELLRGLKYGFKTYYRYSYNFSFLQDMEEEVEYLEQLIIDKENIQDVYGAFYVAIRNRGYEQESKLIKCLDYLEEDIEKASDRLNTLKNRLDDFKYSLKEEPTTIDDYPLW